MILKVLALLGAEKGLRRHVVGFLASISAVVLLVSCDVENPNYETAVGRWKASVVELSENTTLVEIAQALGDSRKSLDIRDINLLDLRWRGANESNDFANENTSAKVSDLLLVFQALNPSFVEIFATDAVGLNIGQTNRTTDFYQADEAWWQTSFKFNGDGNSGKIEFDESSQNWVVPIYVPIRNANGETLGVVKALLNSAAIYSNPTS